MVLFKQVTSQVSTCGQLANAAPVFGKAPPRPKTLAQLDAELAEEKRQREIEAIRYEQDFWAGRGGIVYTDGPIRF